MRARPSPHNRLHIALLAITRGRLSGGFTKYLGHLVPLLRKQSGVSAVDVYVPPEIATPDEFTWPAGDDLRGFRSLRRAIVERRPDVVFIPTARVLRAGEIPVVTMVRNMEPLEVPFNGNAMTEGLKNVMRAAAARFACRRADRVIAVSNHVRDFLVERWRVPADRIGVIRHGVDPAADAEPPMPPVLAPLAGKRFLFTGGSIRPARGLEDAVCALPSLADAVHLVIAGSVDRGAEHYERAMRQLANELGVAPRILWAGQLKADAMSWCFRNAAAFVMTSRAEACPNIVLEALAQGAVSVSTDHPPMPEFFDDTAVYYRERNADDLAARLVETLAVPESERGRLRERARERARAFTWEATARGTVAELQRAIEQT